MSALPSLLPELQAVVGRRLVRSAMVELDTYASDGLPTRFSRPLAVVLPADRDQVVQLVRLLARERIPFVARGAGTGLSGGAVAGGDAVVIALTRLNRIIAVHAGFDHRPAW